MAFPYDRSATNQALGQLGSTYQVPDDGYGTQAAPPPVQPQPAPQAAPPPAQPTYAQSVAPAQATDAEVPGEAKPQEGGGSVQAGLQGVSDGANAAQGMVSQSDSKKAGEGLNKLGALVGTVLAAYSGNYQGAANGVKGMQQQGQAQRQGGQ